MRVNLKYNLLIFCFFAQILLFAPKMSAQHQIFADEISSSLVSCFAQDKDGNVWIGTNRGLNKFNGSSYLAFYASSAAGGLNNDNFVYLSFDEQDNLWFTNECGPGVKVGNTFKARQNSGFDLAYKIEPVDSLSLIMSDRYGLQRISRKDLSTLAVIQDSRYNELCNFTINKKTGDIWFAPQFSVTPFIHKTNAFLNKFQDIKLPESKKVLNLVADRRDQLWIGCTDGTLFIMDLRTEKFLPIPVELHDFCLGGSLLFLDCSADGTIYLGIKGRGMMTYSPDAVSEKIYPEQKLQAEQYKAFMDKDHNIWLSDRKSGVMFYSSRNLFSTLTAMQSAMNDKNIKDIQIDKFNHLWLRSSSDLVCCKKESGVPLKSYSGRYGHMFIDSQGNLWAIENYRNVCCYEVNSSGELLRKQTFNFESNAYSINEDKSGSIWIAMVDRFFLVDKEGSISYRYPPTGVTFSRSLTQKPGGDVFLFTMNNGIYEYGADGQFSAILSAVKNPNCVYKDLKGDYWIGSYNMGFSHYHTDTKELDSYTGPADGLFEPTIKCISEDTQGYIWGSTATNIFRFNPADKTFNYINDTHFGGGNLYNQNSFAKDAEGNLYFGGLGGVTVIHPNRFNLEDEKIKLSLDALLVNGRTYELNGSNTYKLRYKENMLSIWFSGVSFENGSYLEYSYKLEGYDKDWIMSYTNKRAFFSDLPDGNFKFLVRVRLRGGKWSEPQELLHLRIKPAPWNTWWAWCLYLLFVVGACYYLIRLLIEYRTRNERLALAQRTEELRQNQVNFLTNISHEYRTPLSLIYGPLMQLLHSNHLDEQENALLQLMKRNADRIKQLTEQILSVNTLEESWKDHEQLEVCPQNLSELLKQITDNFRFIAHEHHMQVEYFCPEQSPEQTWVDADKLKVIMSNLMSNAIKYGKSFISGEESYIHVNLYFQNQMAVIQVEDNGPGIPKEEAENIFNRYSRFSQDKQVEGSGIGLNYTLHLVSLHRGDINYRQAEPHGSIFTLRIPVDKESYASSEIHRESAFVTHSGKEPMLLDEPIESREGLNTILLAEDNLDIRHYIKQLLRNNYNVITAHDGQEALELIQLQMPDLVISDIVMPRMDGFTFCGKLKQSELCGHLPVILLTAKTDISNKIRGLDCGADSYVSKPFDPSYLLAVINNLLTNRNRLQQLVLNLTSSSEDKESQEAQQTLPKADMIFLKKVHEQMDAHLSDEAFSAKGMAECVNMSYSSLYAKIKSLTGQTPQNYIIAYRMNRSMELLKQHEKTVTEIAYEVGFTSVQYFSRSFKKYFGVSPSEIE